MRIEEVAPGRWQVVEGGLGVATVDGLELAGFQVRKHLGPAVFGVADADGIEVAGGFVREEGGMESAGHDGDAALAAFGGQLVGSGCAGGHEGDANAGGVTGEVHGADVFVHQPDVPVVGGGGGHGQEAEAGMAEEAGDDGPVAGLNPAALRGGADEEEFLAHETTGTIIYTLMEGTKV